MNVRLQSCNSASIPPSFSLLLLNFGFVASLRFGDQPQLQHVVVSHQQRFTSGILHTLAVLEYESWSLWSKLHQLFSFFFGWEFVMANSQTINSVLTKLRMLSEQRLPHHNIVLLFISSLFSQVTNFFDNILQQRRFWLRFSFLHCRIYFQFRQCTINSLYEEQH